MTRPGNVSDLSGIDELTSRRVLYWFASQAQGLQLEILELKDRRQAALELTQTGFNKTVLQLSALLMACQESGWSAEQAFRSSKSVSAQAAVRMKTRRTARAEAYASHRQRVRAWLVKNWGKVMDIRSSGLSWRATAAMINDEHNLKISHTALYNYWRKWNEQLRPQDDQGRTAHHPVYLYSERNCDQNRNRVSANLHEVQAGR